MDQQPQSVQADKETIRLWRVYRTIHQMVSDRGFLVSQASLNITLNDFLASFAAGGSILEYYLNHSISFLFVFLKLLFFNRRSALNFLVEHGKRPEERLFVFFPEDLSVGVKPIRGYLERMNEQGVFRALVIYRQSLTPSASKIMQTMAPKYILEQFAETELVINITQHVLVPQHILLEDEEKKELLERFRLKETQLPRILASDPIARYYGMRRGQVVRIIRASETAGRYITYRIAV